MMNPTGESESDAVRLDFGRRLMLQFRGSSGIRASFIRASASSSPTCRARPSGWSPSTTSAARASNGSKKARPRSSGLGCRAGRSRPTRCGSSFMRWPTISATSCARGDARADQRLVFERVAWPLYGHRQPRRVHEVGQPLGIAHHTRRDRVGADAGQDALARRPWPLDRLCLHALDEIVVDALGRPPQRPVV
jgi:hypothetical protein